MFFFSLKNFFVQEMYMVSLSSDSREFLISLPYIIILQ